MVRALAEFENEPQDGRHVQKDAERTMYGADGCKRHNPRLGFVAKMLRKTVVLDEDAVVVRGVFGTQRIPYREIANVVVERSSALSAGALPLLPIPAAYEDLVIITQGGGRAAVLRRRHFTDAVASQELWDLAARIRQQAFRHQPPVELPADVAAQVSADEQADDRPWWWKP
jgi:hypothetical protein